MGISGTIYKTLFLLHLLAIIVGFGSSFVYPMLAAKTKDLEPKERYAVNHAAFSVSKFLTSYPLYAAGLFGLLLIPASDETWKFSQAWISTAFLLYVLVLLVAVFLHGPNLKAMDELGAKLAAGQVTPPKGDGPPKEVREMTERASKAGMYGGVLHVFFLLLMLDMIFKPGMI